MSFLPAMVPWVWGGGGGSRGSAPPPPTVYGHSDPPLATGEAGRAANSAGSLWTTRFAKTSLLTREARAALQQRARGGPHPVCPGPPVPQRLTGQRVCPQTCRCRVHSALRRFVNAILRRIGSRNPEKFYASVHVKLAEFPRNLRPFECPRGAIRRRYTPHDWTLMNWKACGLWLRSPSKKEANQSNSQSASFVSLRRHSSRREVTMPLPTPKVRACRRTGCPGLWHA